MASRDKVDVDAFLKNIQYALVKLGKSKFGFERPVVTKFKSKRSVGSGNELVDYSRAPCLGADPERHVSSGNEIGASECKLSNQDRRYITRPKGPGKRGHIVADTSLPTQMFPRLLRT